MKRIFYINHDVGSGIEKVGNTISNILAELKVKYYEYKLQNPSFLIYPEIAKYKPDIIILNEFYPRTLEAIYYYRVSYPASAFVLINHDYRKLSSLTTDCEDKDRSYLAVECLTRYTDVIINLNHKPECIRYNGAMAGKIIHHYFPIRDEYTKLVPFKTRKNKFLFFGRVLEQRLSNMFLEKLKSTNIKLDIIGHVDNNSSLYNHPNINVAGEYNIEDHNGIVNALNQYQFIVSTYSVPEVFNIGLAEAIRCGVIPLLQFSCNKEWIGWCNDCIIEHDTIDSLLLDMERKNVLSSRELEYYENVSDTISNKMKDRTSYQSFKCLLESIIESI